MGTLSYRTGEALSQQGPGGSPGIQLSGQHSLVALLCLPLTQQLLRSPASPSLGTESKGVKGNTRYKSLAQISLILASAGGHPCSGIPKAKEKRFRMRDAWTLGVKGHPWRQTSSSGGQGICYGEGWQGGQERGGKMKREREKKSKRQGKSSKGEKGRERRRKMGVYSGVGNMEH